MTLASFSYILAQLNPFSLDMSFLIALVLIIEDSTHMLEPVNHNMSLGMQR